MKNLTSIVLLVSFTICGAYGQTFTITGKVVDEQNKSDKLYQKMSPNYDRSIAFKTACELVFQGKDQPSGYTEPLLHLNRLIKKN